MTVGVRFPLPLPEKKMDCPKSFKENWEWRLRILDQAKRDQGFQEQLKNLFFDDIIFAFNAFFFTLDVRKRPDHNQPFCTWEYQDETILKVQHCIDTGHDILIEKSRDMGASWIIILIFLWNWLKPVGGYDFLLGSRIEDYVDKRGDMRTLMEKARYALYLLPNWLFPEGFKREKHDNYMRLQNPSTGASITGESNNANFSTGGRYAAILLDEFAKWENTDTSAWTAAGDATPCRIPVSTPFGAYGQYYELVTDGKTSRITLHWSLHPEKSKNAYCRFPKEDALVDMHLIRSSWFDAEEARRTQLEIDQELQINYIGSGRPVFDGEAAKSLLWYMKNTNSEPKYYDLEKGCYVPELIHGKQNGILFVYRPYDPEGYYVVSVDVAEGLEGGDASVVLVINGVTLDIDAVHHAQTDEVVLADHTQKICDFYSSAPDAYDAPLAAIETNGPGLATFDRCAANGMTNLFMMPRYDSVKNALTMKKGWKTDKSTRAAIIASVREYLTGRWGKLNYPPIIRECMTFVKDANGKPTAKSGCHDDLVMALGIGLEVLTLNPPPKAKTIINPPSKYEDFFSVDTQSPSMQHSVVDMCLKQALSKREEPQLDLEW